MNVLKQLIKKAKIKNIANCEDYVQIFFADGGILNLYNKTKILGDYNSFKDKIVNKFVLNKEILKIIISQEENIEMSLKNEDYLGPEFRS
ncbi:hypothetical protein AGMMS49587_10410 [Spirochaetia bacterium]|nr:hypothetical protein AGMMS49587_10410 [Spirochaetia bacterium]